MFKRPARWMTTAALVVGALTACNDGPGPTEVTVPFSESLSADLLSGSLYDTDLTAESASLYTRTTGAHLVSRETPEPGTVTVLLDKPYRVGERILVKGNDGIVEEIGLRSTKIRAFTNHLISLPNDQMAEAVIEHIGKWKHIRRATDLHIPLDTRLIAVGESDRRGHDPTQRVGSRAME